MDETVRIGEETTKELASLEGHERAAHGKAKRARYCAPASSNPAMPKKFRVRGCRQSFSGA
jgi:hypothetical protein